MANPEKVSEELLAQFDTLVSSGDSLTVDQIKTRYLASEHFKSSYHQASVMVDVLDLPISVDMLVGDGWESVRRIVGELRSLYGNELMFSISGYNEARLTARVWRSEDALRKAWPGYAEAEYKAGTNLGGAS